VKRLFVLLAVILAGSLVYLAGHWVQDRNTLRQDYEAQLHRFQQYLHRVELHLGLAAESGAEETFHENMVHAVNWLGKLQASTEEMCEYWERIGVNPGEFRNFVADAGFEEMLLEDAAFAAKLERVRMYRETFAFMNQELNGAGFARADRLEIQTKLTRIVKEIYS
jgi:hypothetical protein